MSELPAVAAADGHWTAGVGWPRQDELPLHDPYLIPGTDCLDNLLGITDAGILSGLEADVSLIRVHELMTWRAIPGDYNLGHLQDFHRVIFGDVYPWAGETRIVDIAKPPTVFTLNRDIPAMAEAVFGQLADEQHLRGISDQGAFTTSLAHYYTAVNQLHPFREGNGRTQRAFFQQMASEAGWRLDWLEVSPAALVAAGEAPSLWEGKQIAIEMFGPAISPNPDHPLHIDSARGRAAQLRSTTGRKPQPQAAKPSPARAAQMHAQRLARRYPPAAGPQR